MFSTFSFLCFAMEGCRAELHRASNSQRDGLWLACIFDIITLHLAFLDSVFQGMKVDDFTSPPDTPSLLGD